MVVFERPTNKLKGGVILEGAGIDFFKELVGIMLMDHKVAKVLCQHTLVVTRRNLVSVWTQHMRRLAQGCVKVQKIPTKKKQLLLVKHHPCVTVTSYANLIKI